MAKNTGKGYRQGSVDRRVQVFNPRTKLWAKIDTNTDKIMDVKEDGLPFKGVAKFKDDRLG